MSNSLTSSLEFQRQKINPSFGTVAIENFVESIYDGINSLIKIRTQYSDFHNIRLQIDAKLSDKDEVVKELQLVQSNVKEKESKLNKQRKEVKLLVIAAAHTQYIMYIYY